MMSIAESLRTHLPFMRRYARALTGSQERGDAYIRSVLEVLVADPSALPQGMDMRVALYRMLSALWSASRVDIDEDARASEIWETTADEKLRALPPAARQAFVLVSVEGFSIPDTATVLDVSQEHVDALLDSAAKDIAVQVSTQVLIIEDEPMIALELEQIVEDLGHGVTAIARTQSEAVAAYDANQPGLVLADIQLADGTSGIDAVNDFLGRPETAPPVIFITAYPERLLTGDRPEPTFLITKPFSPNMIKAIVSQALFFNGAAEAVA
jgi:CheY-like chemotaxis protein